MIIKVILRNIFNWYRQHWYEAVAVRDYQHLSKKMDTPYGRELSEDEKTLYNQGS